MIILRQRTFSDNPEQREFNSKAAKERNYKYLKNSKIEDNSRKVKGLEEYYGLKSEPANKISKVLRPNHKYDSLTLTDQFGNVSLNTTGRERNAEIGIGRKTNKALKKIDILDSSAAMRLRREGIPIESTKEYKKSDKLLNDIRRKSPEYNESLAKEKANLRARKQVDDIIKERSNEKKKASERAKKLRIIRENNKFSTKLKKGLKSILSKVK